LTLVDNFILYSYIAAEKNRVEKAMINAYILTVMRTGNTDKAIKEMRKIENVEKISIVAGEYDIVIRVHVKSLDKLLKVTNELQMIDGVKKTTTQVIEKEIAL
jgi:DNA-binding Lrp family transcriptional regulator